MTEDQYENFAAYVFARNAKRHAGATDAEAHAAGVKALDESVWGVGFQRDRHGNQSLTVSAVQATKPETISRRSVNTKAKRLSRKRFAKSTREIRKGRKP